MMLTAHTGQFNLERFWDLESVGVDPADNNSEDNVLNDYLASSVTRDQDGAYVARFPWKPGCPYLPTNFTIAKQRTRQLVKRLSKTPNLLETYYKIIT